MEHYSSSSKTPNVSLATAATSGSRSFTRGRSTAQRAQRFSAKASRTAGSKCAARSLPTSRCKSSSNILNLVGEAFEDVTRHGIQQRQVILCHALHIEEIDPVLTQSRNGGRNFSGVATFSANALRGVLVIADEHDQGVGGDPAQTVGLVAIGLGVQQLGIQRHTLEGFDIIVGYKIICLLVYEMGEKVIFLNVYWFRLDLTVGSVLRCRCPIS